MDRGKGSGKNNNIEEVGISEGGAEVGRSGGTEGFLQDSRGSSDTGLGREFPGSGVSGDAGTEGAGGSGAWVQREGRRPYGVGDCVSWGPFPHWQTEARYRDTDRPPEAIY
jgi:hypothetical protein